MRRRDPFDEPLIPGFFIVAWIFSALVSLGFLALIGWAIYRLVVHFT